MMRIRYTTYIQHLIPDIRLRISKVRLGAMRVDLSYTTDILE